MWPLLFLLLQQKERTKEVASFGRKSEAWGKLALGDGLSSWSCNCYKRIKELQCANAGRLFEAARVSRRFIFSR